MMKYNIKPNDLHTVAEFAIMLNLTTDGILHRIKKLKIKPVAKFKNANLYRPEHLEDIRQFNEGSKKVNAPIISDINMMIKAFLARPLPPKIKWKFY